MFNVNIRMDEIKNMDHLIEGVEAARLENEFKGYKTDFVYRDRDFGIGYNMAKKQCSIQRSRVCHNGRSLSKSKKV